MAKTSIVCAGLALAYAASADAATTPAAGIYEATVYIESASGACIDTPGNLYQARKLSYGGPSGTSFKYWSPIGGSTPEILKEILTVTAGKGTTHPSGTVTGTLFPTELTGKGTWSATVAYFDANSFTIILKQTFETQEGACTEKAALALAKD